MQTTRYISSSSSESSSDSATSDILDHLEIEERKEDGIGPPTDIVDEELRDEWSEISRLPEMRQKPIVAPVINLPPGLSPLEHVS